MLRSRVESSSIKLKNCSISLNVNVDVNVESLNDMSYVCKEVTRHHCNQTAVRFGIRRAMKATLRKVIFLGARETLSQLATAIS